MKLTTITALKDYPQPRELDGHLVQVGPRVDGFIDVHLDGTEVGTLIYERSSPTVPRTHGGSLRTGKSAISRWKFNGRTFYSAGRRLAAALDALRSQA